MGKAADQKVSEIHATRDSLEADLQELHERMPAPLRSLKTLVGGIVTSSIAMGGLGWFVRRHRRASTDGKKAEIVIRVVSEGPEVRIQRAGSRKR